MQFTVRVVRPGGSAVETETLEGSGAEQVRAAVAASGGVLLDLQASSPSRAALRPSDFDVAWWCRELETLLRAGMTAVEAIETLAAARGDLARDAVHRQLLKALREGQPLSRAMRDTGRFPAVLVASAAASERTSTLAEALHEYLRYDGMLRSLERQAISAALYPALVLGLGAAVSVFLLTFVIPRFARMYGEAKSSASAATAFVLWLSQLLRDHGSVLAAAFVLAVVALVLAWRSGHVQRAAAWVADTSPPLRRQLDAFRLAKLYRALAMLVRGGYTFDEALQVAAEQGQGTRWAASIGAARTRIGRGELASSAMAQAGLAELTSERLLAAGERTGSFAQVLQAIADRHAEHFTLFVERATRVIEPVLMLLVALLVGGLVVTMYLPLFDIASGLGTAR